MYTCPLFRPTNSRRLLGFWGARAAFRHGNRHDRPPAQHVISSFNARRFNGKIILHLWFTFKKCVSIARWWTVQKSRWVYLIYIRIIYCTYDNKNISLLIYTYTSCVSSFKNVYTDHTRPFRQKNKQEKRRGELWCENFRERLILWELARVQQPNLFHFLPYIFFFLFYIAKWIYSEVKYILTPNEQLNKTILQNEYAVRVPHRGTGLDRNGNYRIANK